VFAVIAPLLARPALLALGAAATVVVVTWLLQRLSGSEVRPRLTTRRTVLQVSAAWLTMATAVVCAATFSSEPVQWGFRKVPAAQPLIRAFERLSDFDGDGFGLVGRLRDTAPFDASLHPYALEIPGNGVDEDGVGGDLPVDRAEYREGRSTLPAWQEKPPIVLLVLESFRPDVIGARHGGQPVTPVFDRLAREGLKVESAWSHNGFTSQSRFHILTGSLADVRRGTSLLDDFKDHGYEVAYFSAQDDSFGDAPINYARVDTFYDARQDVENRYTRYTTPGSLAVPAVIVEKRIQDFLDARRASAPLFLYVNFHDTHYPYVYPGLENLLGVEPLIPSLISPERRDDLWATYVNTAANVDRAAGRVLDAVTRHVGREPAVIVLSDHGESLFDEGFLGHGYALNESQTRIPLIVNRLPMKVRVPFGQADLRDLVNDSLAAGAGAAMQAPVVESGTEGRVFQYLGPLEQPAQISWLTSSGHFIYDFRIDEVTIGKQRMQPSALPAESQRVFKDLIYTWESMLLARAATRPRR
jgi:Sulfatase